MTGRATHVPHAHMQNFFDCIRERDKEPNCPFELGFRVSIACAHGGRQLPAGPHAALGSEERGDRLAVDRMDFGYTPEQNQLRSTIREFAEAEIRPHVMEWDESQHFPLDVFRELGRLGVLGAVFPEELGGSGYSYVDYSILMEEIARVDPSIALSVAAHVSLCTNHIYLAGNREQQERYIPKLASGEWIGCWSLTEPEAGSDAGGTRTQAVPDGDAWVLNGGKTFTTNAHIADVCVAMAVTDRAASSHGISAFIIEKGTPGFQGREERKQAGDALLADRRGSVHRLPACRRRSCAASAAKGSSTACGFSTAGGSPSRRCRWAWRRALMKRRSNIPSSANNSAGLFLNSRRFSTNWPTWPPRSTPRAC